jgi:hypothetical protein
MVRGTRIPPDAQPAGASGRVAGARPWARRLLAAAAAVTAGAALFAVYLRISFAGYVTSDGANGALQAWDMLHGHLLLHGWVIGSATYYTLDLPVLAAAEAVFGLSDLACHVASAAVYLIVTAAAVALAVEGSRGLARAARGAATVAVLAAMFHVVNDAPDLLGPPDHTGTSAIMLASFLLIDRAPAWRFTPLLLCAGLAAGQIGDATVLYVAVPAVTAVCAWRAVAARSLGTGDAAAALAAAVSVPLAAAVRLVMLLAGGYQMVAPQIAISPPGRWPRNTVYAWGAVRVLFGAVPGPGSPSPARDAGYILGAACVLAAAAGLARVVRTWPAASRAEQLLCAAIILHLSAYVVSTMAGTGAPWEVVAVLPCGAVLAARCVPGHIAGLRGGLAVTLAAAAAVLPLSIAAARPPAAVPAAPLAAWLSARHLTYGLAGYWDSSVITVHTRGAVQVRAVTMRGRQVARYDWEADIGWYAASGHDTAFVILGDGLGPAAEAYFGKPAAVGHVGPWTVLIYRRNLLRQLTAADT